MRQTKALIILVGVVCTAIILLTADNLAEARDNATTEAEALAKITDTDSREAYLRAQVQARGGDVRVTGVGSTGDTWVCVSLPEKPRVCGTSIAAALGWGVATGALTLR